MGIGWKAAPISREEKIAYTDANPLEYWDDDLFGYMRAPSTKDLQKQKEQRMKSRTNETPTTDTITRVSPFRVSTLVSIAPVSITEDFGVMARHEGFPVLMNINFIAQHSRECSRLICAQAALSLTAKKLVSATWMMNGLSERKKRVKT